ncbi:hypothetical protein ACPCTG_31565 [Streptomyces pseudogriseolus]|uniref:hypothetical protein n=1 Tax=Streptomyces pseudogriseolus TaxID=36817 RepID=UPI003FA24FE1
MNPAIKAQVAADLNNLPHARITTQGTEARVFTASLEDLTAWWYALGGRITCQDAPTGSGVCMWTLHTRTDPENPVSARIRVYALALDTDQPDADCLPAVARPAA